MTEESVKKFLEAAADVLEVEPDTLSLDTDFRSEIPGFGSMMGFILIIMMEDDYGVKVSEEEFLECRTIGDLYKKCVTS